jgi:hypothetical protein
MSITVVTARDDNGAPSTREVYEAGVKYVNDNGNLDIISAKPQLLATYGSGNWLSVHVDDSVTVITKAPDESSDDDDFGGFGDDSDSDSSDPFGSDDSTDSDDSDPFGSDADSDSGDATDSDDSDPFGSDDSTDSGDDKDN